MRGSAAAATGARPAGGEAGRVSSARDLYADDRVWFVAAVVALHDGESSHYETMEEGHLMVSVLAQKSHQKIWAMLRCGDDDGDGVWHIPSVGTEVLLGFDQGHFEGNAYVAAVVGRVGNVPVSPGVIVIRGNVQVLAQSGAIVTIEAPEVQINAESSVTVTSPTVTVKDAGLAVSLAKLVELAAFVTGFNAHTHSGVTAGAGFTGVPVTPLAAPVGTTVLTAE